jgi:AraC-like DNA-binding protein
MPQTIQALFAGVDFDRGRLYRTTDIDEARELCGRVFNPHTIAVTGRGQRVRAGMDHLRLGPLSLNRLSWGAAVAVDPDRLRDYYLVSMPLAGRARFALGGTATDVTPHCAGIVNAAERFRFDASEGFEQIVVRVERSAVMAGWQALTGRPADAPPAFRCALPVGGEPWAALAPVLAALARRAQMPAAELPHLDARLAELLVATLLLQQPHDHGDALWAGPARVVPAVQRRAEQYMRGHLDAALTVTAVARACGASVRSLQAAFQSTRGCGPMQWLREQRLQAVREALLRPEAGTAVAQTALRFGFTHLGEFSQAYRRRFGETARTTLGRGAR